MIEGVEIYSFEYFCRSFGDMKVYSNMNFELMYLTTRNGAVSTYTELGAWGVGMGICIVQICMTGHRFVFETRCTRQ